MRWVTKTGKSILVSDMDDQHLLNCLPYCEKRAVALVADEYFNKGFSIENQTKVLMIPYYKREYEDHLYDMGYYELLEEAIKRGLVLPVLTPTYEVV